MSKNSSEPNRTDQRFFLRVRWTEGIISWGNNLIRFGGLVAIFVCITKSIQALAGKTTESNIIVEFVTNIGINKYLAIVLIGGSAWWALRERALRKRVIKHFERRKEELEQEIDPERTSSGLLPTGETRPEDKL